MEFYAVQEDRAMILDYILNETDLRIYDGYSAHDREIMMYDSTESIERKIDAEVRMATFALYSERLGGRLDTRRIDLNPNPEGHKFRYVTEGWGLIHLHFGKVFYNKHTQREQLEHSVINHNSETRARNWYPTIPNLGDPDLWDWKAVGRESRKIENMIKKLSIKENMGATRLVHFIMPGAHTYLKTCAVNKAAGDGTGKI